MPLILGTNSIKDTGYDVANSVRLNRADSANFTRTPSSASNRRTWTWSGWVKRSGLGNIQTLFNGSDGNYPEIFYFDADDKFLYHHDIAGSDYKLISSQVFRDVSAWMHIVVAKDTTQSTETNRLKVYVNGSQITMNESALGYPTQNFEGAININDLHIIGNWKTNSYYVDGYLCEVAFVDGTQLDATSFGEFDEDSPRIWKPKDVSGLTFGTNGFYLDFADSADLGDDESGNGNDWTENNLAATDQSTDTCTNNFATLNPLDPSPNTVVFSEGNLVVTGSGGNGGRFAGGTIGLNSGKWWCEIKVTTNGSYPILGIIDSRSSFKRDDIYMTEGSQTAQNRSAYAVFSNSDIYNNGDDNFGDFGTTYTTGDIIGVGLNLDASPPTLTFQKNGSNEVTVNVEVPPSGFYTFPAIGLYYASAKAEVNFGNSPFSISSGVADANGYGNFEYAPKSGYYSCCTKNLAEYG